MAAPIRFPARALAVGESITVRCAPGEEQPATIRKAKAAIAGQLARAAKAATSERARLEVERRVIVVEKKGRRSITIRREPNAKASRKKAA